MEKNLESEMETGVYGGSQGGFLQMRGIFARILSLFCKYLEGRGDLKSRFMIGITGVIIWLKGYKSTSKSP